MQRSFLFPSATVMLLTAILATAPTASAQWRHFGGQRWEPTGFFGVGPAAPVNPLGSQLNTGWNLAGGFGATQGYAGVMVDFMFSEFGMTNGALLREVARSGHDKFWAITLDPIVHLNPRGPADFYLIGGAGLYGKRTEFRAPAAVTGSAAQFDLIHLDTVYKPGVNAGAGFAFRISPRSRVKVFAEARYHHLFTEGRGESIIPITLGVRF